MAEMVKVPAWMPVHNWVSTPSCGGREGINRTGVSRCPEAKCRIAAFVYYSYCRNRKKYTKAINRASGTIFIDFFKWAKDAMATPPPPPLIVRDSRYSATKPKARRPADPTPNTQKA
jgi:hypothetical protein